MLTQYLNSMPCYIRRVSLRCAVHTDHIASQTQVYTSLSLRQQEEYVPVLLLPLMQATLHRYRCHSQLTAQHSYELLLPLWLC